MLRMMEALKTVVCGSHGAGYKIELNGHRQRASAHAPSR